MKIAIDTRSLLYTRTGIGYFITQILRQFLQRYNCHEYLLYGMKDLGKKLIESYRNGDVNCFDNIRPVPFPFRKISRNYFEWLSSSALKRHDIRIFWGANYEGVFDPGFNTVITIHDLTHIHYPDFRHKQNVFLINGLKEHAEKAAVILSDSVSTKEDIVKYLDVPEKKIRVIYLGVDRHFRPVKDEAAHDKVRKAHGLSDKIILFVGTLQPRKNIGGLIEAFRILIEKENIPHQLVLAGCKGWEHSDVFHKISRHGLTSRVKWLGYVPYEDLPVIYSIADILVLPSFYEGFGFPILEAMACGTPVVTSDVSSMPEVAGDAALLIDPNKPEEIAGAVGRVLNDTALARMLCERGLERVKEFTWEKCADETMRVFEESAGEMK